MVFHIGNSIFHLWLNLLRKTSNRRSLEGLLHTSGENEVLARIDWPPAPPADPYRANSAAMRASASMPASTSSSVLNGEKLNRTAP